MVLIRGRWSRPKSGGMPSQSSELRNVPKKRVDLLAWSHDCLEHTTDNGIPLTRCGLLGDGAEASVVCGVFKAG